MASRSSSVAPFLRAVIVISNCQSLVNSPFLSLHSSLQSCNSLLSSRQSRLRVPSHLFITLVFVRLDLPQVGTDRLSPLHRRDTLNDSTVNKMKRKADTTQEPTTTMRVGVKMCNVDSSVIQHTPADNVSPVNTITGGTRCSDQRLMRYAVRE